ncbi:MAG TPA: hypothetical protein V6C86_01525 [Oculatellaceae cyanobacterium]
MIDPDGHDKQPHEKDEANRAFNTAENALKAIETSRACIGSLLPGPVWSHIAPRGEFEIKGCLTQNGQPVAVLQFNPVDGSVLPKGLHALGSGREDAIPKVKMRLESIAPELKVLEGAEFREPEFCWAVPFAHQGRVVGHIKVSADGSTVVPDRKAVEELSKHQHAW